MLVQTLIKFPSQRGSSNLTDYRFCHLIHISHCSLSSIRETCNGNLGGKIVFKQKLSYFQVDNHRLLLGTHTDFPPIFTLEISTSSWKIFVAVKGHMVQQSCISPLLLKLDNLISNLHWKIPNPYFVFLPHLFSVPTQLREGSAA